MDLKIKETRTGEFYKVVPHGKIPAIVDPHGPAGTAITVW